jgi:dihydroorotate dehydrogenase (fumarate)
MIDLSTRYLGLRLKSPLVVSAGPVSKSLDAAKRAEDAGAAALVMYSLFEEQINREIHELDTFLTQGTESFAEAVDYFPESEVFQFDPDGYVEHLHAMKSALDIPIIGSLNGVSPGGWVQYARHMEQAGADAIELNVYFLATDPMLPSNVVEDNYVEVLEEVRKNVSVPVAVKMGPFFSNIPYMCRRFVDAGADGLVLFNRFYQPDIDLERLEVVPSVSLSSSADLRLPLRWIAILHGRVKASLALSGGVHSGVDALKGLMAGADVTMMMAALLHHGPGFIGTVRQQMLEWMEANEYGSVEQLKGSMSHRAVPEPGAFERANYMKALNLFPIP